MENEMNPNQSTGQAKNFENALLRMIFNTQEYL